MKITSIETYSNEQLCFVEVNFDNGLQGLGQTAPFVADVSAMVMHRQIAPLAIGKELPVDSGAGEIENYANKIAQDPLMAGSPGQLCDEIALSTYKHMGSHIFRTLSGIDTAIWDALGKAAGKPVCTLLGKTPRPVSVYGSSMDRMMEEEEAARMKALYESGYGAFKLHCAHPNGNNTDTVPGRTERVVKLVREAVGSAELYVDVNGNYSPDKAISMIPFLKEYKVSILEEPCRYWELDETREVFRRSRGMDILIAGGEQDYIISQLRGYSSPLAVDIVQPDLCYVGGFSRAMLVARMSHAAGQKTTPHCANRSMIPLFTAHYLCYAENSFPFMEYSIEDEPWTDNVVLGMPAAPNGKFVLTDKPGWGVTINPDWLKKAKYQITK